jgi:hypothetical protein
MAFVLLQPNVTKAETGINVAWRHASNRTYNLLVVSFNAPTLQQLSWHDCARLDAQYCDETARLLLRPAEGNAGFALTRRNAAGRAAGAAPAHMILTLPGIHGDKRRAKPAPWTGDKVEVLVQLPDWAKHPRHTNVLTPVSIGPGTPARSRAA